MSPTDDIWRTDEIEEGGPPGGSGSRPELPTDAPDLAGERYAEAHLAQIWQPGAPPPPPRPSSRGWGSILVALLGALVVLGGAGAGLLAPRGVGTERGSAAPVRTSSPPSPTPSPFVLAPVGLTADAEAFEVTLNWVQPPGGSPVEGYNVYRDSIVLAQLEESETTYVDAILPGKTYTYEVLAFASGTVSSRVAVDVETPVPALKEARIEGIFDVKFKIVSSSGFQTYAGTFDRGWEFTPTCDAGACDVRWRDLDEKSLHGTLKRKADTYTGSDKGDFNSVCGDTEVTSHLSIEFHVTKAKAIDDQWRASQLGGTVVQSEQAQLGCVASEATLSTTARLLG